MVRKTDIVVRNRKRFEEMSEAELQKLVTTLDARRRYLVFLLASKFQTGPLSKGE